MKETKRGYYILYRKEKQKKPGRNKSLGETLGQQTRGEQTL